jgi:hypothetical protein
MSCDARTDSLVPYLPDPGVIRIKRERRIIEKI